MLKRGMASVSLPILMLIIFLSPINLMLSNNEQLVVSLNKYEFKIGELVYITITNLGIDQVQFPNPQPYMVIDAKTGEIIYSPIAPQVIYILGPRRSLTLVWNQTDNNGKQVSPGEYIIVVKYIGGVVKSKKFLIKENQDIVLKYLTYVLILLILITTLIIIVRISR